MVGLGRDRMRSNCFHLESATSEVVETVRIGATVIRAFVSYLCVNDMVFARYRIIWYTGNEKPARDQLLIVAKDQESFTRGIEYSDVVQESDHCGLEDDRLLPPVTALLLV